MTGRLVDDVIGEAEIVTDPCLLNAQYRKMMLCKQFPKVSTLVAKTVRIPLKYGDIFVPAIHVPIVVCLAWIDGTAVLPEATGLELLASCLLPAKLTGLL